MKCRRGNAYNGHWVLIHQHFSILGMIANYKTDIVWNATRKAPNLVRA